LWMRPHSYYTGNVIITGPKRVVIELRQQFLISIIMY